MYVKGIVYAGGSDGGRLHINGNIYGLIWQDWHASGMAKAAIEARAAAIADQKIDARCVTNTRFAGRVETDWFMPGSTTVTHLPSGYVATAGSLAAGGYLAQVGGRQLQIYIPDIGWRPFGSWDE